jgi:hypothetical protein
MYLFPGCVFVHSRRQANQVAHALGQRALSTNQAEELLSRVPPDISKLVERDRALGARSSVCNQNPIRLMNGRWFAKKRKELKAYIETP